MTAYRAKKQLTSSAKLKLLSHYTVVRIHTLVEHLAIEKLSDEQHLDLLSELHTLHNSLIKNKRKQEWVLS